MDRLCLLITLITVLCAALPLATATMVCPSHIQYIPYTTTIRNHGNKCYQFVSEEMFWWDARNFCNRHGGRLVKIDDESTNSFLVNTLNGLWWSNNAVWIGLHDMNSELNWQWVGENKDAHEPMVYKNWGNGHPGALFHDDRDCVRMVRHDRWRWHESYCGHLHWHYRFICQYNALPAPTTTITPTTSVPVQPTPSLQFGVQSRGGALEQQNANRHSGRETTRSTGRAVDGQAKSSRSRDHARVESTVEHLKTVAPTRMTTTEDLEHPLLGAAAIAQQEAINQPSLTGIAGILVGCGAATTIIIIIAVLLFRRRQRKTMTPLPSPDKKPAKHDVIVSVPNNALKDIDDIKMSSDIFARRLPRPLPRIAERRAVSNLYVDAEVLEAAGRQERNALQITHNPTAATSSETAYFPMNGSTKALSANGNKRNISLASDVGYLPMGRHAGADLSKKDRENEEENDEDRVKSEGSEVDCGMGGYDMPKATNIYSEIPELDYLEPENIYEALDDIKA